jgi:sugar phosphate isomerase/epimerase
LRDLIILSSQFDKVFGMNNSNTYQNWGYKVFDRRRDEMEPLLLQVIEEGRALEIGLYYHDPATHDCLNSLLPESGILLNTHLDHRRLNVFALDNDDLIPLLRRQVETSLQWGANYGINHLSAFTLTPRPEYQEALEQKLLTHLQLLNRICQEYAFPVHIENTYHDIDLYRRIFLAINREGLDHLHFCFDFGHAKVWSQRPFRAWMDFLAELERSGQRLHFHLHTNRGLSDQHLSFLEAEWLDLCKIDEYTAPWNCFEALSILQQRFPNARMVMEVPPGEARENLHRVIEEIASLGKQDSRISA